MSLPLIVVIELVIGLISFAIASDKAQLGEIAFLLTFGAIIVALSIYSLI